MSFLLKSEITSSAFIIDRETSDSFDVHRLVRLAMRNLIEKKEPRHTEGVIQHLSQIHPFHKHENRRLWLRYMTRGNSFGVMDRSKYPKVKNG